jgi:hypothetical protein
MTPYWRHRRLVELGLKVSDNPSGAQGPLPVKVEPQRHSLFGSEVGTEFYYRRPQVWLL